MKRNKPYISISGTSRHLEGNKVGAWGAVFLLLIIILPLFFSCTAPHKEVRVLLTQADSLIEQHPDSALSILTSCDPLLSSSESSEVEELRAHHALLLTTARYKLYQPITSDSLIAASEAYYIRSGQKDRLATALYYHGVVLYDLGQKERAVLYLKQAEELAEKGNDELTKAKIYASLDMVNDSICNYLQAIAYAKKLLNSSMNIENIELIALAYDHLGYYYQRLGYADSSTIICENNMQLLPKLGKKRQSYIISNLANDYMGKRNYEKAYNLINRAILLYPKANDYVMLGKIHWERSEKEQAKECWEKVLSFDDKEFSVKAHRLLSRYYSEKGQLNEALNHAYVVDSLNRVEAENMHTAELTEIQHKYDHANAESQIYKWRFVSSLTIFLLLAAAVISVVFYYIYIRCQRIRLLQLIKKAEEVGEQQNLNDGKKMLHTIDKYLKMITAYEEKISRLELSGKELKEKVEVLRHRIEETDKNEDDAITLGKAIYKKLKDGEHVKGFPSKGEEQLLAYFKVCLYDRFQELQKDYKKLSNRYLVFIILKDMGLTDRQIANLLCVTDSTIRQYKHRLNERKQVENGNPNDIIV